MIEIAAERCIGCGKCAADCFPKALRMKEGKPEFTGPCMQCGHCYCVCPVNAVRVPDYPADDVEAADRFPAISSDVLLHTIKLRRSIRRFAPRPPEPAKLERVLQAGRFMPTGGNQQKVSYTLVQDRLPPLKPLVWESLREALETGSLAALGLGDYTERLIRRLGEWQENPCNDQLFFNAPALLIITADTVENGSLAAAAIELMANAEGLGCLFSGFIRRMIMRSPNAMALLELKQPISNCMLIGYPDVAYLRSAPRKPLSLRWI